MRKWCQLQDKEGQSLVELALALPVLLLMFAGLVEVGAALRNYLVLVNANREGTRFAARGRWFDTPDEINYIFQRVVAAGGIENRGSDLVQILRPTVVDGMAENTTIAIHYIEVPDQVDDVGGMQVEPAIVHGPWYSGTLYLGQTRVDAPAVAEQARQENYDFNERYFVIEGLIEIPSEDNFVIIEVWYQHEQLLKLPIFTALLPDEFPLYSQSRMRVTLDSRIQ